MTRKRGEKKDPAAGSGRIFQTRKKTAGGGGAGSFFGFRIGEIWEEGGNYFRDLVRYLVLIQPVAPLPETRTRVHSPLVLPGVTLSP